MKKSKVKKEKKSHSKKKKHSDDKRGPVKISEYMKERKVDAPRSSVTGRVIKMKVKKSRKDKEVCLNCLYAIIFVCISEG